MVVRKIKESDFNQVEKLDKVCSEKYKDVLTGNLLGKLKSDQKQGNPISYAYGMFCGNRMIGYCTLERFPNCGSVLSNVLILPEYQRNQNGTRMVDSVLKGAKFPVYLECLGKQSGFYQKLGFKPLFCDGMMVLERSKSN